MAAVIIMIPRRRACLRWGHPIHVPGASDCGLSRSSADAATSASPDADSRTDEDADAIAADRGVLGADLHLDHDAGRHLLSHPEQDAGPHARVLHRPQGITAAWMCSGRIGITCGRAG